MDSDQGKLFIGGISWETTEETLKEYFGNYGDVLQAVVMRDKLTGKPRGFAFVGFSDPSIIDRVLQDTHTINGRTVEAKRAMSREEQQTSSRAGNVNPARYSGTGGSMRTKKIFVGGLPPTLSADGFRQYFEAYGNVTDVVIMYDQNTQRPRGFGFISFDSEDTVDRVLHKTFHDLNGKQVEVKKALPKDANTGGGGHSLGGGSGNYQVYGASGVNAGGHDVTADSNRYMQPQNTGGGFAPYGSTGYNASGYGFVSTNNGMGYGGGYGGANPGYGGPGAATYGNPNVPTGGYPEGPQGAPKNSWSSQAPSGYGAVGYGNVAASTGQAPGGAAGYKNQAYGYGGYGGGDSSYANPSGYGAVGGHAGIGIGGGESQGNYVGGGYGEANGASVYGNATWRSDTSQSQQQ